MRLLLLATLALLLAAGPGAGAAERLTVRTSLGPAAEDGDRVDLRARGTAPRDSRLLVRFYRGTKQIGIRRPELDGTRYAAEKPITRMGGYTVRVVATKPDGKRIRVSAKLNYGPTAEAPSAPGSGRPAALDSARRRSR